jgi:hypothetical protein
MSCLRVGLVGDGPALGAIRVRLANSTLNMSVADVDAVGQFDTADDCWDDHHRSQVLVTSAQAPTESYLDVVSHQQPNLFHAGTSRSPVDAVAGYVVAAVEEMILAGATRVQVRHPIERSWVGYLRATGGRRKLPRKLAHFDAGDYDYTCAALRDDDVYDGPAVIAHEDELITTRMRVQGYFEPLDGHFHWAGIAFGDEVRALKDARAGAVEVAVGDRDPVPARLAEVTPWGTVRITGVGRPPYPLDDVEILVPR